MNAMTSKTTGSVASARMRTPLSGELLQILLHRNARGRDEIAVDELLPRLHPRLEHRKQREHGEADRRERHEREQRGIGELARDAQAAVGDETLPHQAREGPETPR